MGIFDVNVNATLLIPQELTAALAALLKKGDQIMNDLTQLQKTVSDLGDKVNETTQTLKDLANEVINLKNTSDVQSQIDQLTAKAQTILDNLTVAEDAADDQVPAPPAPPAEPPVEPTP